jgi:cell division control protein 45
MIIDKSDLLGEWAKIKQSAAASPDAITVLVLAALDVDAVATSAILANLLQADEISHTVKPVRDYRALAEIYVADIMESSELRYIIMVNCGARIDLEFHLQQRLDVHDAEREGGVRGVSELPSPDCTWLVLDSHLPLNLENAAPNRTNMLFVKNSDVSDEMEDLLDQVRLRARAG